MVKDTLRDNQTGVAVIVALLAISFITAVTVQLIARTDLQMIGAASYSQAARMEAAIFSGLSVARGALVADQVKDLSDTLQDSWANIDAEMLAGAAGASALSVSVIDLSGRLPVNALVQPKNQAPSTGSGQGGQQPTGPRELEQKYREVWKRFLASGKFAVEGEEEAAALVDAMVDWLDSDDDDHEEDEGAESVYYEGLAPPYSCKNAEIEYIEELLLIKGMSRELLYGDEEHSGIIEYLTIGDQKSKINLNTAPMEVILALHPELTEDMAQEMLTFREDETNRERLKLVEWYKSLSGFGGLNLDQDLLTVESSWFKVTVTASIDQHTRIGSGVLVRDKDGKTQSLKQWKVE